MKEFLGKLLLMCYYVFTLTQTKQHGAGFFLKPLVITLFQQAFLINPSLFFLLLKLVLKNLSQVSTDVFMGI